MLPLRGPCRPWSWFPSAIELPDYGKTENEVPASSVRPVLLRQLPCGLRRPSVMIGSQCKRPPTREHANRRPSMCSRGSSGRRSARQAKWLASVSGTCGSGFGRSPSGAAGVGVRGSQGAQQQRAATAPGRDPAASDPGHGSSPFEPVVRRCGLLLGIHHAHRFPSLQN